MLLRQPPEWDKLGFKFSFKHINHRTFSKTMTNEEMYSSQTFILAIMSLSA